ncbi:MAG: zinc-binding dehydrogenase [Haliscomenobacter sp.]|uniref:zinc-binding dehydrogenase n=1 Tax=Haliscomenobacter sp. TaxID=2717303 RepID=UPI0029A06808|nr:zinc-binding dehydrogenase [Haliscomenobacter sp.]MDX2067501.1 zinc-binding dehydrogenase [Haliscomenobacter sp.]
MKALVLIEANSLPVYQATADPIPAEGEVIVDLKAAALNHRDVFVTQGKYSNIRFPIILGSDGAGTCEGKEVVIYPALNWGNDPRFQGKSFEILGLPRNGTLAEKIAVPASHVFPKPAHLSWAEAAALPLAGLTAYRALFTKGHCQARDKVLITGIGGGVALFALQFAKAVGAEVWVNSSSDEKIAQAIALGAKGGANYKTPDWNKQLEAAGGFDIVIDGAGGEGFGTLLKLCKSGARVVSYGGTIGVVPNFSPQILFWKQLEVLGTTMGTADEFGQMLDFVSQHQLISIVDQVLPLEEGAQAFKRMEVGGQFGKLVVMTY